MAHLEQWSLRGEYFEYVAEAGPKSFLNGIVTDHPTQVDGTHVDTSRVIEFNKVTALTKSGTLYTLGKLDAQYADWLAEHVRAA